MSINDEKKQDIESIDRRKFLVKAGKYSVATSSAVVMVMSTTREAKAGSIFVSGGAKPGGPKPVKVKGRKVRKFKRKVIRRQVRKRFASLFRR